ncbi:MAG: AmmeMemoRadiSam system protein B [Fibrobacterota bacterium]|nr:AmmeMemoRadiSam system protein B [Chitinispirillaceae bacterium]
MATTHAETSSAADIRPAAVAGKFYTSSPAALRKEIVSYCSHKPSVDGTVRMLISPHAGYIFSGPVAGAGYSLISKSISKVILIGPSHYEHINGITLTDKSIYQTPLGDISVDIELVNVLRKSPLVHMSKNAELPEHSLEVQLPFLQVQLENFKIIPILTGKTDPDAVAELLFPYIDKNTLVVASSDLSHYFPQTDARELDNKTIATIIAGESKGFIEGCGETPIRIVMALAKKLNCTPMKLDARTSWETAPDYGEKNRVVGYASIAFVEKDQSTKPDVRKNNDELTSDEHALLLDIARKSLVACVTKKDMVLVDVPDALKENRGCFVTLTINNSLRGCIGYIEPIMPLYKAVIENARNAALSDPRFDPVTKSELDKICIEVSVLTVPVPLVYNDTDDLLKKLRPQIDGVILSYHGAQSTFLPQVWEQLPDKIQFLQHLSMKAGLSADSWKKASYKVYQAEHFKESCKQ